MILYMWFFTVCSERYKEWAISLFVRPCTIKGTSCCWRRVSPNLAFIRALGTNDFPCCDTALNKVMQNCGGHTAWFFVTLRTAATTSAAEASFSRYPAAPARIALRNRSGSSSISISRGLIKWGPRPISVSKGHSGGWAETESNTRTSVPELMTNLATPGTQGELPHTLKRGSLRNILARASRRSRFSATRKTQGSSCDIWHPLGTREP